MSRRICSKRSGRATAGSYSTSACSCVRLTATLSTPGMRPRAFSMVPVHSEQCRPPILARIVFRSGRLVGSSVQAMAVLMVRRYTPRALRRTAHRFRTSAPDQTSRAPVPRGDRRRYAPRRRPWRVRAGCAARTRHTTFPAHEAAHAASVFPPEFLLGCRKPATRGQLDMWSDGRSAVGSPTPHGQAPSNTLLDLDEILQLAVEFARLDAQELMDVRARRPAALANRYDLFDLSARNSEAACLLHEVQHPDGLGIVEAVPIRGTLSRRQNALALIEANRLRRDPGPTGQFTDLETAIHDVPSLNLYP